MIAGSLPSEVRFPMRSLFLGLTATLCLLPAAGPPARMTPAVPRTLRVAAVQMRSQRDIDANVRHTIRLLRECAAQRAQVAVFPECNVSGYFDDYTPTLSAKALTAAETALCRACKELKIAAVVGLPVRQGKKLFNSAVVIDRTGTVKERYHKVQLAERWPDPGDHLSVFRLDGVPCSIIICHDERYPELVRLPVLAGARVVFYLSHESPLAQERKLEPYRAQIQARAVENSVYIAHANAPANPDATGSHGQSRLIAPDGNLIAEASMFREEVLTATFDLARANAGNARGSLARGPLGAWWRAGLKHVRQID
jgi:predicted amidohydrolase